MGELRNAARTRKKILEAARDEFAARGFAGGRIESIAQRAGVTKQLIVHHFGNKEALFEETLRSKYEQHRAALPQEDGPGAAFVYRFRAAMADPVWIRFLTWEAVEHQDSGRITAEGSRRDAVARQAAIIAERQARGELPADLPATLLQLATYALGLYPVAFPQTVEMITGRSLEDPQFQAEWTAFLDELGRRLAQS
jgi:TetR/AcrR family transcriptional regulator